MKNAIMYAGPWLVDNRDQGDTRMKTAGSPDTPGPVIPATPVAPAAPAAPATPVPQTASLGTFLQPEELKKLLPAVLGASLLAGGAGALHAYQTKSEDPEETPEERRSRIIRNALGFGGVTAGALGLGIPSALVMARALGFADPHRTKTPPDFGQKVTNAVVDNIAPVTGGLAGAGYGVYRGISRAGEAAENAARAGRHRLAALLGPGTLPAGSNLFDWDPATKTFRSPPAPHAGAGAGAGSTATRFIEALRRNMYAGGNTALATADNAVQAIREFVSSHATDREGRSALKALGRDSALWDWMAPAAGGGRSALSPADRRAIVRAAIDTTRSRANPGMRNLARASASSGSVYGAAGAGLGFLLPVLLGQGAKWLSGVNLKEPTFEAPRVNP